MSRACAAPSCSTTFRADASPPPTRSRGRCAGARAMRRLRPPGRLSTSTGRALSDSWKATLPCTKAEAEAVAADISQLVLLETTPVLMTREPDPVRPEEWLPEAYFDEAPSPEPLSALKALAPKPGDVHPHARMRKRREGTE